MEELARYKTEHNLTYWDLAQLLGTSDRTIWRWIHGTHDPQKRFRDRIKRLLENENPQIPKHPGI